MRLTCTCRPGEPEWPCAIHDPPSEYRRKSIGEPPIRPMPECRCCGRVQIEAAEAEAERQGKVSRLTAEIELLNGKLLGALDEHQYDRIAMGKAVEIIRAETHSDDCDCKFCTKLAGAIALLVTRLGGDFPHRVVTQLPRCACGGFELPFIHGRFAAYVELVDEAGNRWIHGKTPCYQDPRNFDLSDARAALMSTPSTRERGVSSKTKNEDNDV